MKEQPESPMLLVSDEQLAPREVGPCWYKGTPDDENYRPHHEMCYGTTMVPGFSAKDVRSIYEAALARSKDGTGWVPCSESIPKADEFVLLYLKPGPGVMKGVYDHDGVAYALFSDGLRPIEEPFIVTHHAPLPPSPPAV